MLSAALPQNRGHHTNAVNHFLYIDYVVALLALLVVREVCLKAHTGKEQALLALRPGRQPKGVVPSYTRGLSQEAVLTLLGAVEKRSGLRTRWAVPTSV